MKKIYFLVSIICIAQFSSVLAFTQEELDGANFMGASNYIVNNASEPSKYRLGDSITRREMMKVILNISGTSLGNTCEGKFSDVPASDWGCKYIEPALTLGIIANNSAFRPDDSISKAEALKMILKVRGIEKTSDTGNWQADYVATAYAQSWYSEKWTDYGTSATRGWIFMSGNSIINDIKAKGEVDDTESILSDLFDFLK